MTQLLAFIRSARVRASLFSILSLVAVVMAGADGSKWARLPF